MTDHQNCSAGNESEDGCVSATREGHDEPCYYCGEPCNSLAGNPGLWPIALCHRDDPGRVKWHHTNCVSERLIENQPTTEPQAAWKPMETAPQDGTQVVLNSRTVPYVGAFRRGYPEEPQSWELGWRSSCCGRFTNPTGWSPLPRPQSESGK